MSRRPYIRTVRRYSWWLAQGRYIRYMTREATSLFIGAYTAVLVVGLSRLAAGKDAWEAYLEVLQSLPGLVFHIVALLFALYHTVTWFNVTPKAMPLEIAGRRLPGAVIAGAHYVVWAAISVALFLLAGT